MQVNVYMPPDRLHREVLACFAEGIRKVSDHEVHEVNLVDQKFSSPDTVHVIFGVEKRLVEWTEHRGEVLRLAKSSGQRAVVIDSGYIHREDAPDRYFAVGLDGLNGEANFRNHGMPSDRWADLQRYASLEPWRQSGAYYLLCGQVPWDASCQDIRHDLFMETTFHQLKAMDPKMDVWYRPHPRMGRPWDGSSVAWVDPEVPLKEHLKDAKAVVTWNSNSGVDALLAGVPVVPYGPNHMYDRVFSPAIHNLVYPARYQWVCNLAYTQWTTHEMKEGLPWQHLFR